MFLQSTWSAAAVSIFTGEWAGSWQVPASRRLQFSTAVTLEFLGSPGRDGSGGAFQRRRTVSASPRLCDLSAGRRRCFDAGQGASA
jgi:hypothetical protein